MNKLLYQSWHLPGSRENNLYWDGLRSLFCTPVYQECCNCRINNITDFQGKLFETVIRLFAPRCDGASGV